jgi:ERCC4-type nuclease
VEELMEVETINERVAREIYAFFHSDNTQKDGN